VVARWQEIPQCLIKSVCVHLVEIYFSIVQRKVVTPNDFTSLRELEDRLMAFQRRYEQTAKPFQWAFTRKDLADLLAKLKAKELGRAA
jgi:hypothetical protein